MMSSLSTYIGLILSGFFDSSSFFCHGSGSVAPAPVPDTGANNTWSFTIADNDNHHFLPIANSTPPTDGYQYMYLGFSYVQVNADGGATDFDGLAQAFQDLQPWLAPEEVNILFTAPPLYCPEPGCLSTEDCIYIYTCFMSALSGQNPMDDRLWLSDYLGPEQGGIGGDFEECITEHYLKARAARKSTICAAILTNTSYIETQSQPCSAATWSLNGENWNEANTDNDLQTFWHGGVTGSTVGGYGLAFDKKDSTEDFSVALKAQFGTANSPSCNLKNPCSPTTSCEDVGILFTRAKPVLRIRSAYFALWALRNINQQLNNQWQALQGARIEGALATFNIGDYFPKSNRQFPLLNVLSGLGVVFASVGGFLPPLAAAELGAASAILPAIGTYVDRQLASSVEAGDPNIATKTFAPKFRRIFRNFTSILENVTAELFAGHPINGKNITDMLTDGAWISPATLTDVSVAQDQIFIEIFSRAINSFWQQPTSNKRWVTYVDLKDDANGTKCSTHDKGPIHFRYCADGGVYYAYNFIESGERQGHVDYPWGTDQIYGKLGIEPRV